MLYPYRTCRPVIVAAWIALGASSPAAAQEPQQSDPALGAAEAALAVCSAAAAHGSHVEARTAADIAESAFRARLHRKPEDVRALVGLARTLGQCRMADAELMRVGELSAESVELLRRALTADPRHWLARYVLAINYYRSPSFMNRGELAAREFDVLIHQQGTRNDVAEFARPFEYRGMLWSRAGNRDSAVVVWRRGLRLFPADTALRARLGLSAVSDAAPEAGVQASPPDVAEELVRLDRPALVEGVTITVSAATADARATPSERWLRRSDIVMTAGATADVFHALQLQPGVTRVGEGVDLHTRGGDPAETPVFVNGGRLLSVSRFEGLSGGLFGAIDPFVVRSVRYSSGGFSVRHGNALSGLVDVETDGRPADAQWRVGLGLAQGGFTIRRALGDRTGAWGSLRATHAGALLHTHRRVAEFDGSPASLEGMASIIVQPAPGHEVRILTLMERDRSARYVDANGFNGAFRASGATQAVVISTQHLAAGRPAILRANLSLASRSNGWEFGVLTRDRLERSALARTELEYFPSEGVTVRLGGEGGLLSRMYSGRVPLTGDVSAGAPFRELADEQASTWTAASFLEAEWRLAFARVLAGVRADRLPGEVEMTVDPRLSISTRSGVWTARVSGGLFHQGRWRGEPAIPDAGVPSGLPREAVHLVAGVEREGRFPLRLEAFHKNYGDYGVFGAGPRIVDGSARGFDLLVQKPAAPRLSGWLGYSYLDSEVRLADGSTTRSPFDVSHTATASATVRLARGTSLGSTVRYGTGRPFTPILGATAGPAADRFEPIYGAPTSQRLPAYSRLDTRLTQFFPLRRSLLTGYAEVINLLGRENVSGYVWDASYRTRRATSTFYGQRTVVVGVEIQSQ